MKICDLTQSYSETGGGVKTYLHAKRNYISEKSDIEHVLIVPGENDEAETNGRLKQYTVEAKEIPGCEPYRFMINVNKIYQILKHEEPEVVELGDVYMNAYPAMLYQKQSRCVLSGFYHTDFPTAYVQPFLHSYLGQGAASMGTHLTEKYACWIYNQFDVTLTSSEEFEKKLKTLGIGRITHLPLGVDLDVFHPNKRDPEFRSQLGLRENEFLLIYTGRLDKEKRVDLIIDAFKQIEAQFPGKLLMVGNGPLKDMVQSNSTLDSNILFLPYQEKRENLARILASSDIYVTAGPHETFGLAIIEAQACGLPVVGVAGGALKERVPDKVGTLGRIDSAIDLANNMMKMASNGMKEKGVQARQLIEESFSWKRTFSTLFYIYLQLLKSKQTGKYAS
jgi:alpha-1,6-mannosyltransferase